MTFSFILTVPGLFMYVTIYFRASAVIERKTINGCLSVYYKSQDPLSLCIWGCTHAREACIAYHLQKGWLIGCIGAWVEESCDVPPVFILLFQRGPETQTTYTCRGKWITLALSGIYMVWNSWKGCLEKRVTETSTVVRNTEELSVLLRASLCTVRHSASV